MSALHTFAAVTTSIIAIIACGIFMRELILNAPRIASALLGIPQDAEGDES